MSKKTTKPCSKPAPIALLLSITALFYIPFVGSQETYELEIQTQEVSRPDVTLSPDGRTLVFTLLGHLFRLSVNGGEAEQLTFGPYFDSEPAFSPDGDRIAFVSDRDTDADGNIFLLDLVTGELVQLTNEQFASRPVWSPDGESIAYLSYQALGNWAQYEFVAPLGVNSQAKVISANGGGGEPEVLTPEHDFIHDLFYLPDGRLAMSVVEGQTATSGTRSRIDALGTDGVFTTQLTIDGVADRVTADVGRNGLFVRHYQIESAGFLVPQPEALIFVSLDDPSQRREITRLLSPQPRPGFGLGSESIYIGEAGGLWSVDFDTGIREALDFTATAQMQAYPISAPISYSSADPGGTRAHSILDPRLAGDGSTLIFTAAGYIWQQSVAGGDAVRLLASDGFEWGAAAPSPDGSRLAYQHSEGNTQELRLTDLESGHTRTLLVADRTGRFEPAWSPNGEQLVYVHFDSAVPSLYLLDVETGKSRLLIRSIPAWMPRPHFSADGSYVYYTQRNQVFRVSTEDGSEPEALSRIAAMHVTDGTVSPDGNWLAFRRNDEIWVAELGNGLVMNQNIRQLSDDGGFNYSFSPDSEAIVYATGTTVWHHSLTGDTREEIVTNLELPAGDTQALLIRNVRVLDFAAGGFSPATSIYISDGKIRWIGNESDHDIAEQASIVDAQNRYAIPGLFDSHTHVATPIHFNPARDVSNMASNIAFGVTSVRDMGSDITLVKAWEDRRVNYRAPVPRIFSAGAMVEVRGPFFHGGSYFVETEEQARSLVRKEKRDGAIAIKSYFTLPWPLQRVIADEARKENIPVVAHGLIFREMVMGPVLGRLSIEHQPSPIRVYSDVLQLLRQTGTKWDPTIAPIGGNGVLFAQHPTMLSQAKVRAFTSRGDYAMAEEVELFAVLDPQVLGRSYADLLASVGQAHGMGVGILAGTDALNPNVFYGHGLHMELIHMSRAQIAPLDILRLATLEAAETVGAGDELGSIEAGKLADILLLDKNPLEDINNAREIWRVIMDGHLFTSNAELIDN